ncbi:hypothetical protein RJ498_003174 [Pluralibacter gergoviae]
MKRQKAAICFIKPAGCKSKFQAGGQGYQKREFYHLKAQPDQLSTKTDENL